MLKIYKPDEVKLDAVIQSEGHWDYPFEEIDYLLEEARDENAGYVVYGRRLWEVFPEDVKDVIE